MNQRESGREPVTPSSARSIALIVAMACHRVIGRNNQMPWHLPADLAHFKQITLGKPIIMGRKTFESIGRPLPGRQNIVVTGNPEWHAQGISIVAGIQQAIAIAEQGTELIVMGGATLYEQFLPLASRLYLTHIDLEIDGDTHFPQYAGYGWEETAVEAHHSDSKNLYNYRFVTLERIP